MIELRIDEILILAQARDALAAKMIQCDDITMLARAHTAIIEVLRHGILLCDDNPLLLESCVQETDPL